MTQDTRKDRRVKIVSLNVRYKSATVDEFIENHSHDVSKGGIFIKTANPFPPGTLLKFEIRLSGDQAVIAGVGRVVWKRESAGSAADRPAGMGVKFIKVDDSSKQTIDKLVTTKADAGSAYESESPNDEPTAIVPPPEPKPSPAAATTPALGARASMARKGTMMGLGAVSASEPPGPAAASPSNPPAVTVAPVVAAGGSGGSFFPETGGAADMPPKQEQTVMKQAAELLEEALKEAGGSMAEVGHNPLFTAPAAQTSEPKKEATPAKELEATVNERKRPSSNPPPENEPDLERTAVAAPTDLAATVPDDGLRAAPKPKPAEPRPEPAPSTARESPSAKSLASAAVAADAGEERKVKTVPPKARAVEVEPTAAKKGGAGAYIALFAVVAVVGIGLIMFRDKLFGGGIAPVPTTSMTAATTTTPPPEKSTAPAATTSAPAATDAVDAATAEKGQDAGVKDAAAPVDAARPAVNPVAPVFPTQTATQPTATAPQPTVTATATQPTATATATAPAPTVTATATATQTAKPPPPPPPPTSTGAPINPY